MITARRIGLQKNFTRMFWIRVFLNVKFLNIVASLFYISRGLTLQHILWLAVFWSVGTTLFEIPSSYLADVWGRKKTIMMALGFTLLQLSIMMYAEGFLQMGIAFLVYGLASANISGTDIALLYDTKKELGEQEGISVISKYWAGLNFGKIISGLIGVYIARDLADNQFQLLIIFDMIGTFIALILASRLIEPNHKMDVQQMEAGIMKDAIRLLRKTPFFFRSMLNGEFVWLGSYALWSYYQVFYYDLGVTVTMIGIVWSCVHFSNFMTRYHMSKFVSEEKVSHAINISTIWIALGLAFIVGGYYSGWNGNILFLLWAVTGVGWGLRKPLFDTYYNSFSHSFNRATTLSLTNLVHNVLEIPIMLGLSLLIALDPIYPYVGVLGLVLIALFILPVPHVSNPTT